MKNKAFQLCSAAILVTAAAAATTQIVDLRRHHQHLSVPDKIAIQACAGLYNRRQNDEGGVYIISTQEDEKWMDRLGIAAKEDEADKTALVGGGSSSSSTFKAAARRALGKNHHDESGQSPRPTTVQPREFLQQCLETFPRRIRYDYRKQRALIPNILTLGAVLDAIPLQDNVSEGEVTVAADTLYLFANGDAVQATDYVFETYGHLTSALAKINPGHASSWWYGHAELDLTLIDLVFAKRLFVMFLPNSCIPGTASHELLEHMTFSNPYWPSPVPVYGYDTSWNVLGAYLFEAETTCVSSRSLGAIATGSNSSNLSYLMAKKQKEDKVRPRAVAASTRRDGVQRNTSVQANAASTKLSSSVGSHPKRLVYNASKTYVAFVVGDGDNIGYLKTTRADWMERRHRNCQRQRLHGGEKEMLHHLCLPLTWTISPHLRSLAPALLEWYQRKATPGRDAFMLPPSGHLYAYPASMPVDVQDEFVALTEQDALLLNTSSTMDWELVHQWNKTVTEFYPKYAKNGIIRGIFPSNVPYFLPMLQLNSLRGQKSGNGISPFFSFVFDADEYFRLIGPAGSTTDSPTNDNPQQRKPPIVWFRPQEWRSGRFSSLEMADSVASYPQGTVAYVYMTSDDGWHFHHFEELSYHVRDGAEHVQLVTTDQAVDLALQKVAADKRKKKKANPNRSA